MILDYITDVGKVRKINEDYCAVFGNEKYSYIIVADGMGGHQAGEVASKMAVELIEKHISEYIDDSMDVIEASKIIKGAFTNANSTIFEYAQTNSKVMGMGTTTTLVMVYDEHIIVAHVGDSRAYIIDKNEIRQITKDHSYVQELVDAGDITPEQAKTHPKKNFITRAMGTEDTVKVDISVLDYKDETLLVCSDGLINFVDEEYILKEINKNTKMNAALKHLVKKANSNGGRDNITVAAMRKE